MDSLLSEAQDMMAAFFQEGLQGCDAGCAARAIQSCSSDQGPCSPGCYVLGQGFSRLPGSALSLPGELPTALWGEAVGGRSDPRQGRVLLLHGSGLLTAPDHAQSISEGSFHEYGHGRGFLLESLLS